jgi:alpha-beta hydrolase superfamily lysophospholipase
MEHILFPSEGLEIHGILHPASTLKSRVVVFCHGAFEFQENWFDYAGRMNDKGLSAFTFDFAGHGKSQGLRSLVNLRVWAYNLRDALTALQNRGYGPFALVGWGIGGSAVLLAAAHDRRIDCAVTLSAPVLLQPPLAETVAYGLITGAAKIKQALFKRPLTLSRLNELDQMLLLSDDEANERYVSDERVRQIYAAVPIPDSLDSVWMDIRGAVGNVRLPVLVLQAGDDSIVRVDQSRKLFDLLKGHKELHLIEDSGHALHLDQRKYDVFDLILNWIKAHSKDDASRVSGRHE